MICMFIIMMFINILQDKNIYFILTRVTSMCMQKALKHKCSCMKFFTSKIHVNVPISQFKKSSKYYLQYDSLVLKYTK